MLYGGVAPSQVASEPGPDEVNALSSDLDVIFVSSSVPSPSDPLFPSNPLSRHQMTNDLPDYDERLRIQQRALVRQFPRVGRNSRHVTRLMANAAEKEYHAYPVVSEV